MTRSSQLLLFGFLIFTFFSCEKTLSPNDLKIHFTTNFPLKDLIFEGDQWIACGGETFEPGSILCQDSDNQVMIDTLSDYSINRIFKKNFESNELFFSGVYSYGIYSNQTWSIKTIPELYLMKDIITLENEVILVGGAGLSTGVLYFLSEDMNQHGYQLRYEKLFENDLYFVKQIGNKTFIGGFGILSVTEDIRNDGEWKILDEFEDHWIDIEATEEEILILGASGRIIESKDEGLTWKELQAPSLSGVSDNKDLLIYGDQLYLACGANICVSDKGSLEWETIELEMEGEINRLVGNNQRIYFVTNSGEVASIAH